MPKTEQKNETLVNVNFRMPQWRKDRLEEIAAENSRTLTGQLNSLADECIKSIDGETKKAKKKS